MVDLPPPPTYSTAPSDERFARRLLLVGNELEDAARAIAGLRRIDGWEAPSALVFAGQVDRITATLARTASLVADARQQATASARLQ